MGNGPEPPLVASSVDVEGLSVGETIPLVSVDDGSALTEDLFDLSRNGSRFAIALNDEGTALCATMLKATNFIHLNFNGDGTTVAGVTASDSTYRPKNWEGVSGTADGVLRERAVNGMAVKVYNSFRPYWQSLEAEGSAIQDAPLHAEGGTITLCLKANVDSPKSSMPIMALGGYYQGRTRSVVLTQKANSTVAVVHGKADKTMVELATLSDIEDWTTKYHFIAVTLTPERTILQVDDRIVTGAACPSFETDVVGCFGRTFGGPNGIGAIDANGFWLDDFRVYDAVLTQDEKELVRRKIFSSGLMLIVR